jgi:hypothetical protein
MGTRNFACAFFLGKGGIEGAIAVNWCFILLLGLWWWLGGSQLEDFALDLATVKSTSVFSVVDVREECGPCAAVTDGGMVVVVGGGIAFFFFFGKNPKKSNLVTSAPLTRTSLTAQGTSVQGDWVASLWTLRTCCIPSKASLPALPGAGGGSS